MEYKVTNPRQIKRIIESNPDDIKELTIEIKNNDSFLDSLLDDLNEDSDWPLAVCPTLIVDPNNRSECEIRAKNIIDMIVERDLYGLSVLDFGCGDGLVAAEMLIRGASKIIGYDIQPHQWWNAEGNLHLTVDWHKVVENAPYDFILIYDVLDHVVNEDPVEILTKLKNLLAPDGIITIRFHPWIARHGAHLYTQLNRAFAHVIFSQEQLQRKGYEIIPTRKIIHPIYVYKKWIEKSNLKIIKEDKIMEPVEDYFINNELLKSLIHKHYKNSHLEEYREGKGLERILSFHFVDFLLKK